MKRMYGKVFLEENWNENLFGVGKRCGVRG